MNGHFEIEESNYPIGAMRSLGDYRVFDMRTLNALHDTAVSREAAYEAAKVVNRGIRNGSLPSVADSPAVAAAVAAHIEAHS